MQPTSEAQQARLPKSCLRTRSGMTTKGLQEAPPIREQCSSGQTAELWALEFPSTVTGTTLGNAVADDFPFRLANVSLFASLRGWDNCPPSFVLLLYGYLSLSSMDPMRIDRLLRITSCAIALMVIPSLKACNVVCIIFTTRNQTNIQSEGRVHLHG